MRLVQSSFLLTQGALVASSTAVAHLDERLGMRGTATHLEARPPMGPHAPLDLPVRLRVLHDLDVTRGAGVQALADIAAVSSDVTLGAGQRLLSRGAKHDRLFVVVDGEIEMH